MPKRNAGRLGDPADDYDVLLIERAVVTERVAIEVDRPLAFRPRLVGFWRGTEFHLITRVIATRREHDVTYHRVLTPQGGFDLCHVRRMDPLTLRPRHCWELCAELDVVPIARLP